MKKLLIPFAVIVLLTGCVAVRLKPGASVEVTSTNPPPVINNVVTNPITIPNTFVASLDTNSQKALVDAIRAAGDKTNVQIVLLQTNLNPINVYPVVTNAASFPNPVNIVLDQETIDKLKPGIWSALSPFLTTLLGAIIALAGSQFVFHHEKRSEKKKKNNILHAIRREIEAMKEIYDGGCTPLISSMSPGGIFPAPVSASVNWLTVYEGNSEYLGSFEPDTVKKLLRARAKILSLFESLRLNNGLLDKWSQISKSSIPSQSYVGATSLTTLEKEVYQRLQNRAQSIKASHDAMQAAVVDLFTHLDEKGIS